MSYDFLMFRPCVKIFSQNDLSKDTVELQDPQVVMHGLSSLFPSLSWQQWRADSFWEAQVESDGLWYEFHVGPGRDAAWSIKTSHRATNRPLVQRICRELGVIAFDGQAMLIIDENGARPA